MPSSSAATVRLRFVDAEPAQPDPAAVGTVARSTLSSLRGAGETLEPAYTGEKSGAELFLWVLAGASVVNTLIALPDFALRVAQLLNEIKKLRGTDAPTPSAPPVVVHIHVGTATTTLHSDTAPGDAALLTDLLAQRLPAEIDPTTATIEVQVPPTPPNEL